MPSASPAPLLSRLAPRGPSPSPREVCSSPPSAAQADPPRAPQRRRQRRRRLAARRPRGSPCGPGWGRRPARPHLAMRGDDLAARSFRSSRRGFRYPRPGLRRRSGACYWGSGEGGGRRQRRGEQTARRGTAEPRILSRFLPTRPQQPQPCRRPPPLPRAPPAPARCLRPRTRAVAPRPRSSSQPAAGQMCPSIPPCEPRHPSCLRNLPPRA
mmetsp:Transcript_3274/g.6863  ORF Transcript_3274/g.6863 Transcript_3274/m.6863 type:complete len:212 (-) Transcript_3274:24-659(-)